MAQCECLETCAFFNDKMANMPGTSSIYKKKYCEGDNSECARYMVFKALGPGTTPADMFPNQVDKAREFIASQQ